MAWIRLGFRVVNLDHVACLTERDVKHADGRLLPVVDLHLVSGERITGLSHAESAEVLAFIAGVAPRPGLPLDPPA
jgi:hypothetical protein